MAFTKITAAGIGSTETVTLDGLSVINNETIGGNLTVTGNATVGGVLTYEDVTNVDSVGLITARNGIVVGSGITLSKDGDGFFTGIVTATTFSGAFSGDGSSLTGVANTDVIFTDKLSLPDNGRIALGISSDLQLYHNGSASYIDETGTGALYIRGSDLYLTDEDGTNMLYAANNAGVSLHYGGGAKLQTSSTGVTVTGTVAATAYTGDGSALTGIAGTSFIHAEQVNVSGVVTATGLVGDFAPRNMLINGAMQINERESGTLTINSSTGQYPCDRWVARAESSSKQFTIEKTSIASSGRGVRNALKITSSQAASVGTNDIFNVRQKIEGYNIQRLNLGEAGCASMALSFTVRSSVAGTHSGAIQNTNQDRSYPFTYTLVANTWTDVKITIPPITSGSFNEANSAGLIVVFDMGSGSGFRGTAGSWNSAQDEGATGAVRVIETNGATWEVTKVQLEEGTVATPFEKKLYSDELAQCMRYFERVRVDSFPMQPAGNNGVNNETRIPYKVTKRAAPTVTKDGNLSLTLNGSNSNNTDHTLGGGNTTAATYGIHVFAVISGSSYSHATMVNSATFLCDAEL